MNDKFSHIKWWNNKRKEKNDLNNCETYNRLKNMSEQELMFEYINAKVNYRHLKKYMDIKYSVGDVGAFKYLQGLCCVYESGKKNQQ